MRVRPATAQDGVTLAAFRRALFAELGESPAAGFERQAAAAFVARLEREFCLAWLAETDDRRLPTPDSPADRDGISPQRPTLCHDGAGTESHGALVAAAVARGRELGMARIRLHTTDQGRPVYAAAGFVQRQDELELVLARRGGTLEPGAVLPG